MSQFEKSMYTIIEVFHKYARMDGDPKTLNHKEFKQLVEENMPDLLKKLKVREINQLFKDLDKDNNDKLSFEEAVELISMIYKMVNEETHNDESTRAHGHGRGPSYGPSLREASHGSCDKK